MPGEIANAGFNLNGAGVANGQIIVVGEGTSVTKRLILASADGISWTIDKQWSTSGRQNNVKAIASSSTRTIAVGDMLWSKP